MGIDIKITNKLDNNCVQVEVNSNKGGQSKYFKVPVDKADSFIANYKKNDKTHPSLQTQHLFRLFSAVYFFLV